MNSIPELNPRSSENFESETDMKRALDGPGSLTASAHASSSELSWAFASHTGAVRSENEDFAGAHMPSEPGESIPLFVVADGMGGHAAGEVASRLAVEAVLGAWAGDLSVPLHQALRAAVRRGNADVFAASLDNGRRGMGTTLTALILASREAVVAHVGDSRAYRIRGEALTQLTSDHSRVAEMLRMRLITPEQAVSHPGRAMLTRSLGTEPSVQVDIARADIMPGDVFVLCSDGLWDLVSRREIAEAAAREPDAAASALIELALKRGAPDNVTVTVVKVASDISIPAGVRVKSRWSFFRR